MKKLEKLSYEKFTKILESFDEFKDYHKCVKCDKHIFYENDKPNPYDNTRTAKQIWYDDKLRYETLQREHNIKTIIIWESEYRDKLFNLTKFLEENGILF